MFCHLSSQLKRSINPFKWLVASLSNIFPFVELHTYSYILFIIFKNLNIFSKHILSYIFVIIYFRLQKYIHIYFLKYFRMQIYFLTITQNGFRVGYHKINSTYGYHPDLFFIYINLSIFEFNCSFLKGSRKIFIFIFVDSPLSVGVVHYGKNTVLFIYIYFFFFNL